MLTHIEQKQKTKQKTTLIIDKITLSENNT